MGFLDILFKPSKPKVPEKSAPEEAVYLTRTVTFGMHRYRTAEEDSSVFFVDESRGIRKMLIDSKGNIQNFPGMVKEEFWIREVAPNYLKPQIRFRSSFEKRDSGWIFLWQIQPDGWYWADEDGFGAENDSEVTLYTLVDMDGKFTQPFQIYQLGNIGYSLERFRTSHRRAMESTLKSLTDEEQYTYCSYGIFPTLLGTWTNHVSDRFYQLRDKAEALAYWDDPVLRRDLKILAQGLLDTQKPLWNILGRDQGKVKRCMTLFHQLTKEPVFGLVLDKYFEGKADAFTMEHI